MNVLREFADSEDEWRQQGDLLKALVKAKLIGPPHVNPHLGRFELIREVGHGAAGAVYEVRDSDTGGTLALKLLRARSGIAIHAFKAEFRGLTHLVHENLVQLHELFSDGEHSYFTMELVRGVRFTQYVRDRRAGAAELDYQRLTRVLLQLLSGVQAIHDAGKLHCDLKPSNVLVTERERVVVLDFGLLISAHALHDSGSEWRKPGTAPYMAPELVLAHDWTEASDAYAVGVMLFQALTGQQPSAAALLERSLPDAPESLTRVCAALLEPAPSARFSIREALHALRARPTPARAAPQRVVAEPLIGRERELTELRLAQVEARAGKPVAVFVRGCSGIGKSALVARFADEVRAHAVVLSSTCYERESLSYKAFDGCADALAERCAALPRAELGVTAREAAALLKIFPAFAVCVAPGPDAEADLPRSSQEQRQLAFGALKQLMRRLTQHHPLVLISDDLQWADLDSAHLLLELLGPPAAPALLYVGCYRSEEEQRSEFLREIWREDTTRVCQVERRRIDLEPFDATQSAAMALSLLSSRMRAPEVVAARIGRESGGIPFFVRELVSYFLERPEGDPAKITLSELVEGRLSELTSVEKLALELVSLAGRPVESQLLGRALGGDASAARSLRVLTLQGLVNADAQGRLVLYHDRLREMVVRSVPSQRAPSLHRRLAQAYEGARSAEPEWLIEHWREAGEPARAFEYARVAAAHAANKLAFHRAAELYGAALELYPNRDGQWRDLCAARGEALVNAGTGAEAANAFLAAADGAEPDAAYAMRCRAAQQYLRCGRTADATSLLRELFRAAGQRYPEAPADVTLQYLLARGRLAARTLWPRAIRRNSTQRTQRSLQVLGAAFRECTISDPARGLLFQSLYYENALRTRDSEATFIGFAWDTYNAALIGGARKRHKIAPRLVRLDALARRLDTAYARGTALFVRGAAALWSGDYTNAALLTERAQTVFREECLGAAWEEATCAMFGYVAVENVGPLQKLCREAPVLVRRADEHKDQLSDALLCGYMATALLVEDRAEEAIEFMKQRASRCSNEVGMEIVNVGTRLTDAFIYAGRGLEAWETWQRVWPVYLRSGGERVEFLCMMGHLRRAHAALLANRVLKDAALDSVVLEAAARLERLRRTDASGVAQSIRAGLAFQHGRLHDARSHMRRAVSLIERVNTPVTEQCYRLQLGRILPGRVGALMVAHAETALRSYGVVSPERWASVYVTGFADA